MVGPGRSWLDPALRWQSAVASIATAGFCLPALVGLETGVTLQMIVLLTGIVLIGFPHGAFDHLVARTVLARRLGRAWWGFFLAGYLGLAGLVWLAWIVAPGLTLGGFLASTVLHFGLGDTEDAPTNVGASRWIALLTSGSLPVLLPMAVHPGEAAPVLAAMGGIAPLMMQHWLAGTVWLLPIWAVAFVSVEARRWRPGAETIGRLITVAGFVLLPPLLAFGLYFGFGHSAKHLLRVMAWHDAGNFRVACRWAARVIAPASIACAAGIAALAWIGDNASIYILAQSFRVIAALTLPHIIVTTWLDRPARETQVMGHWSAGAAD